jgi:hypothetical protein
MAQVHYKKVPDTYDFFSLNEPEIGTALKQVSPATLEEKDDW